MFHDFIAQLRRFVILIEQEANYYQDKIQKIPLSLDCRSIVHLWEIGSYKNAYNVV